MFDLSIADKYMLKVTNGGIRETSVELVLISLLPTLNRFCALTHFSPVLRFMQKPVKWLVSIRNTTRGWNRLSVWIVDLEKQAQFQNCDLILRKYGNTQKSGCWFTTHWSKKVSPDYYYYCYYLHHDFCYFYLAELGSSQSESL